MIDLDDIDKHDLDDITADSSKWYSFTAQTIDTKIIPGCPGVYLLAFPHIARIQTTIGRLWVGRSDTDLRELLHQRLRDLNKEHGKLSPTLFKIQVVLDAKEAWDRECELFHRYTAIKKIVDRQHPPSPHGAKLRCQRCSYVGGSDLSD
jgi:hypothetical protein